MPTDSTLYGFTFTVTTLLYLVAGLGVTWKAGARFELVLTSILPVGIIWYELAHVSEREYYILIPIFVGAWQAWLGSSILAVAKDFTHKALGWLWLGNAAYQTAFALRLMVSTDQWLEINSWLPSIWATLLFTVIAIGGRHGFGERGAVGANTP